MRVIINRRECPLEIFHGFKIKLRVNWFQAYSLSVAFARWKFLPEINESKHDYNAYNILQMNLNLKTNESTLFFSCKFSNKKCIILPADMAAFSRGCKASINLCKMSC